MSELLSRLLATPTSAVGGAATLRIVADCLVWLAYICVPLLLLIRGWRHARSLRRVFGLLALFVACCGVVDGARVMSADRGGAGTAVAAAVIAWGMALAMLRFLPRAAVAVEQHAHGAELEQLQLLEAAVTASGDGVVIAETAPDDESGPRIVYANPAFEQILGYSAEEALGLTPSVFCAPEGPLTESRTMIDPDAEAEVEARRTIRTALSGNRAVRLELPTRRKDNTRVWTEWQLVPVTAAGGRHTHWVGVIRDTTERRRLEDQLRQAQKMEAVGRLAGGVAHDFNNLLTVIRGNADLLRDMGSATNATTELVDDIRGAADRAASLVKQLLTFSRRQPARPEVVDLNEVIDGVAGLLRRMLGDRVSLVTDPDAESVRVRIDRSQLEQVLVNLAVNARDAMPTGGTLRVTTESVFDRAGLGGPPIRFARLSLMDTGCGMSEIVKAKIFEPFFTTKGPGKGTGLGLATVYGIVQHAGGKIAVESTQGIGTTFHIDLPWCESPVGQTSGMLPIPGRSAATGRGRTVLLVEDENAVRKLARFTLEAQGYAVIEAPDGEAALDLLPSSPVPDLLVTDLSMPGMDGRELAARVRAILPGVGVVFVSGYAPDAGRLDGVPGAVFLPKPFTPDELTRSATRAIRRLQTVNATPA